MLRRVVKVPKPLFVRAYGRGSSADDTLNEKAQEDAYFAKRDEELIRKLSHQKEEITKTQKVTHEIKGEIKKQHEETHDKLDNLLETIKKLQEEVQQLKQKK